MTHCHSAFLNLPPEVRLQIFQHLLPDEGVLAVNFCAIKSATRQDFSNKPKRSPIASFLSDRSLVSDFTRRFGLHLVAVCTQLQTEYIPLIANATTVKPHCHECLDRLFSHLVRDLEISPPLFYHLELRVRFSPDYRFWRSRVSAIDNEKTLYSALEDVRSVVGKHYGRYDLLDDDEAYIGKRQRWVLKRVTRHKKIIKFNHETNMPEFEEKEKIKEKCFANMNEVRGHDTNIMPNADWDLAIIHENAGHLEEWYVLGELGL